MVTEINEADCADHLATSTNREPLPRAPDTDVTLHVNSTSVKKSHGKTTSVLTWGQSLTDTEQLRKNRQWGHFLVPPQQALRTLTETNSEVIRDPALKGRCKREAFKWLLGYLQFGIIYTSINSANKKINREFYQSFLKMKNKNAINVSPGKMFKRKENLCILEWNIIWCRIYTVIALL